MWCYYCGKEHSINVCKQFKKDRDKYSLRMAEIANRKSSMTISEAALSSRPQELTYSVDEAKQLIGGMQLSDASSDSD